LVNYWDKDYKLFQKTFNDIKIKTSDKICYIYKEKCWSFRHYENFALYGSHIVPVINCTSMLKKSNKMQLYADIYLLLNYSTCFERPSRPSSEVHKTVVVQRLQLQFYALMMGAMDARNM